MTGGIHWVVRNDEQFSHLLNDIRQRPFPYQVKIGSIASPKTTKQVRYAHSLCGALAAYKQASLEAAKKDAKVAFGVVVVSQSIVTGERTARLTSFADYKKSEMEGFITSMEAYLSENQIPFTPSE